MMNDRISLDQLAVGESLTVEYMGGEREMRRRLEDLGLTEGSSVRCLMTSPLGDPRAYEIRGAVIALRQRDAEGVLGVRERRDGGDSDEARL